MLDEHVLGYRKSLLDSVAKKLEKNGFSAFLAESPADALKKALEIIGPDETVGFGGSQTVKQLKLIENLKSRGQKTIVHQPGMDPEETMEVRRAAVKADVYVASPNAITMKGELMFVDQIGNRAAGMMFGPRKVIAIAGFNKIVADEAAGRYRIDNVASPINARRLGYKVPCAVTGSCTDCDSPQRMCGIALSLWRRPTHTEYHVILVTEDMGY